MVSRFLAVFLVSCWTRVAFSLRAHNASAEALNKACVVEHYKSSEPMPTRSSACNACTELPACVTCYSVVSSCDPSKFAWSCHDPNEHFKIVEKQGNDPELDEPDEMQGFKDKQPEKC
mmetsp:Transcript_113390/g.219636  ORF Transcript_113390/g.219636 Transcript_113390/m.219636 type:complete len:118 (-) Transcript_113390:41-394(-)